MGNLGSGFPCPVSNGANRRSTFSIHEPFESQGVPVVKQKGQLSLRFQQAGKVFNEAWLVFNPLQDRMTKNKVDRVDVK